MSMSERGVYAPPLDGDFRLDADDHEEDSQRGAVLLGVSGIVLLAVAGLVWSTYKQGLRVGGEAPPKITAPPEPYKVAPADPGGATADNLDARVFDVLESEIAAHKGAVDTAVEPTDRAVTWTSTSAASPRREAATPDAHAPAGKVKTEDEAGPLTFSQTEDPSWREPYAPPAGLEPADAPAMSERSHADRVEKPERIASAAPPAASRPEPASAARTEPASAPPSRPAPAAAAHRAVPSTAPAPVLLQVGSFKSQDAAEHGWAQLKRQYADLFAGHDPDIARVDRGQWGVWYRVRVHFSDITSALAFCDAFSSHGEKCLIVQ
jgi:cell division protein FtsN